MALGSTICALRASSNHFWNWSIGSEARSDSSSPAMVYSRRSSAIFIRSVVALLVCGVEMFSVLVEFPDTLRGKGLRDLVFFVQPFAKVDEFAAFGAEWAVGA